MPTSLEPLEDFSFVVNWGGMRTGMRRVSPLRWEYYRGEPSRWIGPSEFGPEGAGAYFLRADCAGTRDCSRRSGISDVGD